MTRAIRNNNPLNIRYSKSNYWIGKLHTTDPEFEQFESMELGFRAAILLMQRYIADYKLNTIEKIVTRWAPPSENNTKGYIQCVCRDTRLGGREVIPFDSAQLKAIIWSMAHVEAGVEIDQYKDDFNRAWDLYRKRPKS
ncbi:MAG: structural protein P5 [Paludibacteraceae bacterium]|nr:structural protein P5 [Paludibacteraceae bacterium]